MENKISDAVFDHLIIIDSNYLGVAILDSSDQAYENTVAIEQFDDFLVGWAEVIASTKSLELRNSRERASARLLISIKFKRSLIAFTYSE